MQISLMEAYIIETLKTKFTYEEVEQQLIQGDLSAFEDLNFDLALLQQLFDNNPAGLKEAYTHSYSVKFLTMNGLKNILRLRFGITEENYEIREFGVYGVKADPDTEREIASILSSNWKITRQGDTINLFV